jgi:hypothetical protein
MRPRKTHGRSRTPEYRAWQDAIQRCTNPSNVHFKDYGARGIEVRYTAFPEFFAELGARPDGLTLDRIDNDGHYEPGNCRWATPTQQVLNSRTKANSPFCVHGVTWHATASKYRIQLRTPQGRKYLGLTADFFEACCIRKSAENHYLSSTTQA